MTTVIARPIPRRNWSQALHKKYLVETCQDTVKDSEGETRWLKLKTLIQSSATGKVFVGSFELPVSRLSKVVVKVAASHSLDLEVRIFRLLLEHGIPNVFKVYCFFTCGNPDVERFLTQEHVPPRICSGPGDDLGIIIMPYYKETMDSFKTDRQGVVRLVKHVVYTALMAFTVVKVVHGDLHLGNVMIDNTKKVEIEYTDDKKQVVRVPTGGIKPVIIDFGKGVVPGDARGLWTEVLRFLMLVESRWSVRLRSLTSAVTDWRYGDEFPGLRYLDNLIDTAFR